MSEKSQDILYISVYVRCVKRYEERADSPTPTPKDRDQIQYPTSDRKLHASTARIGKWYILVDMSEKSQDILYISVYVQCVKRYEERADSPTPTPKNRDQIQYPTSDHELHASTARVGQCHILVDMSKKSQDILHISVYIRCVKRYEVKANSPRPTPKDRDQTQYPTSDHELHASTARVGQCHILVDMSKKSQDILHMSVYVQCVKSYEERGGSPTLTPKNRDISDNHSSSTSALKTAPCTSSAIQ
jgi:hypothetical protein